METREGGRKFFVSLCVCLVLLGPSPDRISTTTRIRSASAFVTTGRSLPTRNPRDCYKRGTTATASFRSSNSNSLVPASGNPCTRMSSLPSTTGKDEGRFGFHEIVERDGKKVPIASNTDIAIKLLVVAPIWATLVLPLTIAYQAGKSVLGLVRGSPALPEEQSENASGDDGPVLVVDPGDVIPRTDRKHDVVVLGATGFTGGLAVRHLAKTYGTGNGGRVRWAIAGRSEPKLKAVLERLANELEMPELAGDGAVDIILCDTSDSSTLPGLVRNTRSVATTAGPFSLYGKGVVEHCAKFGTHYADITGETSFVKSMKSKHQDAAVESGARILSLCGNDCVPWDLSYNLLADEFAARFGSESMESVEFGNEFSSSASGGTLKTMCMGMDGRLEQIDEKDQNILRRAFGSETEHEAPMENGISFGIRSGVPKPWMLGAVSGGSNKDTEDSSLVEAPFVMSGVNYESVGWSHALRRDPKCSYKEQLLLPDYKSALDGVLGLVLFFTSLLNPLTLGLLENYLVTQPGDGPGMTEMEEDFFLAVTGTARGTKGTLVQSLLYYNKDPGYLETARMVVECALCLALEEEAVSKNIAEASPEAAAKSNDDDTVGGFFTPGFALRKNLLKRLVDTGCHYELRVVEEADETSSSSVSQTAGSAGTEREQPTAL